MSFNPGYTPEQRAEARAATLVHQLTVNAVANPAPPASITDVTDGVATLTLNSPPVNSFSPAVAVAIGKAYEQAIADPKVKAIVITGAGKFFMAGADIPHLQQLSKRKNKAEITEFLSKGHALANRIESGPKPTVAAVNGPALGGGLELAMACNARVAHGRSSFGLPELKLGVIPGLGGTQRLPRLVGLKTAVSSILSSKPLNAKKAHKLGLVDVLVKKPNQLAEAAHKLALAIANGQAPRRKALYLEDKIGSIPEGTLVLDGAALKSAKKAKNIPHPAYALEAIRTGLLKGGEAGLAKEQELFNEAVRGPTAEALIHFFFASKATSKVKGIPKPKGKIKNVAIIGGGTMGSGIVIVYLLKGYNVILKEVNDDYLQAGVKRVVQSIQMVIKSRRMNPMALEFLMRNLTAQTSYDNFDKLDLVIEAVIENVPLKQKIFKELEQVTSKHCILSSNTSTINVEEIGALVPNAQDRILGLHYFAPAHIMPLLEIVRTDKTSTDVLATCIADGKAIGKTPVVVGNCVGFVANRIFAPYGQAAVLLADRGVHPYRIDKALENFGMPMGVFKMTDLSGVDIFMHVGGMINGAYGDRTYNTALGGLLFDAKRLGQKTKIGYYKYKGRKAIPDPEGLQPFLDASRKKGGNKPSLDKELTDKDIVELILFNVVNESFRTVDEGFADKDTDIDAVSVMGYGFPAYRGGVWKYGEMAGFRYVRDRLANWSKTLGANDAKAAAFFAPCDLLNKYAEKSQK